MVRFQDGAAPSLPKRRNSVTVADPVAAASSAVLATRRRTNAVLLKVQTERATTQAAQQLQRLAMQTIGSLEPAAVQGFFDNQVPDLFGHQAPAQARLSLLLADHGIQDGAQIIDITMRAMDRLLNAALAGNAEGSSPALQPTPSRQEQAAFQRLFDALEQIRGSTSAAALPPAGENRIHDLETDADVAAFLAETGQHPIDNGPTQGLPPASDNGDAATSLRGQYPPSELEGRGMLAGLLDGMNGGAIPRFIKQVLENRTFDSKAAQWAATANNVALRNLASVGVTVFGRELLAYGIEHALNQHGVSAQNRRALSALLGPGCQAFAHAVGVYRDFAAGTASKESVASRGISALTAIGAFMVEDALNLSQTTTATHAAMTAYAHVREVGAQSWLRLPAAKETAQDKTHFWFMSVAYGLDQMLASMTMSMLAPTSGAGAALAGQSLREAAGAAGIRGALNTAYEVGDELLNEGNRALRAGHGLEKALEVDVRQRHFVNALLGQQPARAAVLSAVQSLTAVIALEMAKKKASPQTTLMVTALMTGLVNGAQYWPRMTSASGQPKVASSPADVEQGLALDDVGSPRVSSDDARSPQIEELDSSDPQLAHLPVLDSHPVIEEPDGAHPNG
ncbi:hypothetical protein [Variovorax sp. 770b2]|uniref:hypothetical protein n=1 Tax=Variovorax sp. 770b2 TaxID=1566271 RepID=UPI000B81269F|nr:hypothetical protein [Variovorax sp. 770b2]